MRSSSSLSFLPHPPLALARALSLSVGIDFSLCVQLYQESGKRGLGPEMGVGEERSRSSQGSIKRDERREENKENVKNLFRRRGE